MRNSTRRAVVGSMLLALVLLVFLGGPGRAAAFSTNDLAGTWYFQAQWDSPLENDPGWDSGTMNINTAGTVTGGSFVDASGEAGSITGGSFTIDATTGVVSGSVTTPFGTVPRTVWLRVAGIFDAGFYEYNAIRGYLPLVTARRVYGVATANQIDAEVKKIVTAAYDRAEKIVNDNQKVMHRLARTLLEKEVLDGEEVLQIIAEETGTDISKLRKSGPPKPPIVTPPGAPEVADDVGPLVPEPA